MGADQTGEGAASPPVTLVITGSGGPGQAMPGGERDAGYMRLKKIRLAGFKSFVDPTTVNLPGSMVGIVGPNGCGKSNVIDAVRWVMGESSARHLRGESMTDVIFNGSSSRKPVGQASIELVFDNSDGALGGQYASYAEISVKRQVNRESQSQYFLNGSRCRRRDVTDVFLGTGLGPRSYSIIEQGMISRIIEAKPEDLRVYLEEAAGISLYKERRRETERRIRGTRENMERLNDVREEVGVQLEKLRRQAQTAERFRELKRDERRLRAELLALRLRELSMNLVSCERELQERETALQAAVSRQRRAEREMVEGRERQRQLGEELNAAQGRYYAVGSDIARIEQQIGHHRELRQRRAEELKAGTQALEELEHTLSQDRDKLRVLEQRLQSLQPELEEAAEEEAEASEQVARAQSALGDWQAQWDAFNEQAAGSLQEAEIQRTRIEHMEERQHELQRRRERLVEERSSLDPGGLEQELHSLRDEQQELAQLRDEHVNALCQLDRRLEGLVEEERSLAGELQHLRDARQQRDARLTSLETLQQGALADAGEAVAEWLARHGLDDAARLAQVLTVESGWEAAVERVLGEHLQAVCASDPDPRQPGPERGQLTLIDTGRDPGEQMPSRRLPALQDRVSAPWPVHDLLAGIYCADSLEEALRERDALAAGESVVTPAGEWLGRRWLRTGQADDGQQGVLAREREIAELRSRLDADAAALADLEERIGLLREQRLAVEQEQLQARQRRDELGESLSAVGGRLHTREQRLDDVREREARLADEIDDAADGMEQARQAVRGARALLQQALDRCEELDSQRAALQEKREQLQQAVDDARERRRKCREQRHALSLKQEGAVTARDSIVEQLRRLEAQHRRLSERTGSLRETAREEGDPVAELEAQREVLLEQRVSAEQTLNQARSRLGEVDQQLRELDQTRLAAENECEVLRRELESSRLRRQELHLRHQTQADQLQELDVELETVERDLPEDASEAVWLKRLADIEGRIGRLGSINLAAIEEREALAERKGYLDQQYDDLNEALETLDTAIRRIDRETRTRFRTTFDRVNAGLGRMYPRLFGGGEAYLELTGEDLLDTGVSILARPPGKRVTNIHLLSGGEKALTAVAMIFAIFELNPAPFCMLDEVDAPLDEANVGRFCELVREMSARVQFVFITHNKTTMEIASHLMGVTMHEAGVSRLVAVDVDEAADMALAV